MAELSSEWICLSGALATSFFISVWLIFPTFRGCSFRVSFNLGVQNEMVALSEMREPYFLNLTRFAVVFEGDPNIIYIFGDFMVVPPRCTGLEALKTCLGVSVPFSNSTTDR